MAYDWQMLRTSVPRVYEHADLLVFSIDKYRKSWSGSPYNFDEAGFSALLREIDPQNKIQIYEDDFSNTKNNPLENDNLQRNLMGKFMGEGGWHIQIDADEYFLDFLQFKNYLKNYNPNPQPSQKAVNISVNLIPLLKKIDDENNDNKQNTGYIFVDFKDKNFETAPFATNLPIYHAARRNGHFNHISPAFALHETWARSEMELRHKINNWGHRDDFDKESYFRLWLALDAHNYKYIQDFHPIEGKVWKGLGFCEAKNIDELLEILPKKQDFSIDKNKTFWENSRIWQKIRSMMK